MPDTTDATARAVKTPLTDPHHHVIGHRFKAWDGHIYVCDSFDPRQGYWMTREDAPPEHWQDQSGTWRTNVSGRAIDATFWTIWEDGGRRFCGMTTHRPIPPAPPTGPLDQFAAGRVHPAARPRPDAATD